MSEYRHYVRIDSNNIVIHGFSDAFETAIDGDIQLAGDNGRHFQILLIDDRRQYKYKIENSVMTLRTQEELDIEWNAKPEPPPTDSERIKMLEDSVVALVDISVQRGQITQEEASNILPIDSV